MPYLVLLLAVWLAAIPARAAEPLTGAALVAALRAGGATLYVRHGLAGDGKDEDPVGLGSCDRQRRLSPPGRDAALAIGDGARRLALPIGPVLTSPYCRAVETATLAFGSATVDHDLRLWHGFLEPGMRQALTPVLRARLAEPVPTGRLRVLVSHSNKDAVGREIGEGDALLVRSDGQGGFTVLAQVAPADWAALPTPMPARIVLAYPLPPGVRADLLAAGDASVWVAARGGRALRRLDIATGGVGDVVPAPGDVRALAVIDENIAVATGTGWWRLTDGRWWPTARPMPAGVPMPADVFAMLPAGAGTPRDRVARRAGDGQVIVWGSDRDHGLLLVDRPR
jgi:hypothetical protein